MREDWRRGSGWLALDVRGSWGHLGRLGDRNGELEVNNQAAFGSIFGFSVATVEMNGALGDRKTKAGTAGGTFAGIGHAVEGNENIGKTLDRHAATVVAHANGGLPAGAVFGCEEADFYVGAFLGVADGVANDVFDGAAENFAISSDGARLRGDDADETIAAARFEIRVGDDVTQERVEINGTLLHRELRHFPGEPGAAGCRSGR